MARDHRRLAAIVSLDLAGYSRRMGVHESGTLAALKAHRRELIGPGVTTISAIRKSMHPGAELAGCEPPFDGLRQAGGPD